MEINKPLIIANWKSNQAFDQVVDWFGVIGPNVPGNIELVVCPPSIWLKPIRDLINQKSFNVKVGAQDISKFSIGPYTGELPADLARGVIDCCIIGHSERRQLFGETSADLLDKFNHLSRNGITPIYFLDTSQIEELKPIANSDLVVAYEPIEAIGSGNAQPVEEVRIAVEKIKQIAHESRVLYGGSVDENNLLNYLSLEDLEGALVGTASLDSSQFLTLLEKASSLSK